MKKPLILTLVLFTLFLSACTLGKNNGNETKTNPVNQSNQPNIVGNDRDEHGCIGSAGYSWCEIKQKCLRPWEEKCEADSPSATSTLKANSSIYSEKLGIKVSYYSNPENKTSSKADGSRIYFYFDGPATTSDYKSGQYLEGFAKEAESSFQSAIENKFLQNIRKDKCFVKITEDTAEYQKAIIDYPDTLCPNGSPAFTCNSCPANYSKTNGISYFIYYKNQPKMFFYFSIGQYSLTIGAPEWKSSLEWYNNIEFIK